MHAILSGAFNTTSSGLYEAFGLDIVTISTAGYIYPYWPAVEMVTVSTQMLRFLRHERTFVVVACCCSGGLELIHYMLHRLHLCVHLFIYIYIYIYIVKEVYIAVALRCTRGYGNALRVARYKIPTQMPRFSGEERRLSPSLSSLYCI